MNDIAIYGAGGFGREVACLIRHLNEATSEKWNLIGFFDDGKIKGTENRYGSILGGIDDLNAYSKPLAIVMAIGSPKTIKILTEKIQNPLISYPNLIAPSVLFFDQETTSMGIGNVITFGCRLSCNTKLGNFSILNGCVSLGHDAQVGNYNVLMPEVRLSGEVTIGDQNLLGGRCFIVQQIKVGDRTTIGAGSVVLRKTKSDSLYLGNPAKKIEI